MEHAEPQTGADSWNHQLVKMTSTWAEIIRKPGGARGLERVPRADATEDHAPQPKLEDKAEEATRIIAQLLEIADAFRTTFFKAMNLAQDVSHPPKNKRTSKSHAPAAATGALDAQPVPLIDPTDPASAVDILRAFDHDNLLEAIKDTGSTIRKWQKQCKEYRDRAKGKISFRNFSKGDLALFLPMRNTTSKTWAAFNGV
jgi:autophagy-related protein 11